MRDGSTVTDERNPLSAGKPLPVFPRAAEFPKLVAFGDPYASGVGRR
jgi:hypothetical protein